MNNTENCFNQKETNYRIITMDRTNINYNCNYNNRITN